LNAALETITVSRNRYRVVKPDKVNSGGKTLAFNLLGFGTQYEIPVSIAALLRLGIIEKVP
jgi:hypothetical protein